MDYALASNHPTSPLMLADRLLTLAQDADRAGYLDAASQLVCLVYAVLDQQIPKHASIVGSGSRGRSGGEPARQARQFRRADHGLARASQPQA